MICENIIEESYFTNVYVKYIAFTTVGLSEWVLGGGGGAL